jgi:hypothetical protein
VIVGSSGGWGDEHGISRQRQDLRGLCLCIYLSCLFVLVVTLQSLLFTLWSLFLHSGLGLGLGLLHLGLGLASWSWS